MLKSARRSITKTAGRSVMGLMLCSMFSLNPAAASDEAIPPVAAVIQPGDSAAIKMVCRLKDGEVVVATDAAAVQTLPKSRIYMQRDDKSVLTITAATSGSFVQRERAFEDEIVDRLASVIVGMKEGESRTVKVTSEVQSERKPDQYVMKLPRVRIRSKEMRMPPGDYHFRAKKAAEVGQAFTLDPAFPGKVENVTDNEVVVRFTGTSGAVIDTPFGAGRISEDEKNYYVTLDARKDSLVRTGIFIGRISAVDENTMTIDYRHPFGFETLTCDITVDKITKDKLSLSATGK
jgi:FKBP-type peptidyl-prolyl cis-trans isomerase 2